MPCDKILIANLMIINENSCYKNYTKTMHILI